MYELIVLSSAAKQLSEFNKPVRNKIIAVLGEIAENPFVGDCLNGDLATLYSYHLKAAGVEYRIAYQTKEQEVVVIVMQIGTRENFYKELKKRFNKRF